MDRVNDRSEPLLVRSDTSQNEQVRKGVVADRTPEADDLLNALSAVQTECRGETTSDEYLVTDPEESGAVVLAGNRCGLLRVAEICINLADATPGDHHHMDAASELDESGVDVILSRIAAPWE
jgi:hypothetical protein